VQRPGQSIWRKPDAANRRRKAFRKIGPTVTDDCKAPSLGWFRRKETPSARNRGSPSRRSSLSGTVDRDVPGGLTIRSVGSGSGFSARTTKSLRTSFTPGTARASSTACCSSAGEATVPDRRAGDTIGNTHLDWAHAECCIVHQSSLYPHNGLSVTHQCRVARAAAAGFETDNEDGKKTESGAGPTSQHDADHTC
jgi:hypothetical protein